MWVMEWHLDWAPAALTAALADARLRNVDLVWVSAPPVRNLFVAYVLSRLLKKPLVIDLRDPWTYGSLWVPRGKVAERLERAWARRILGHARRVVFTSPLTQAEMARRHPYAAQKFRTITNGFSESEIEPLRGGHEDKCLFRYVGLLNVRRTPEPILEGLSIACRDPLVARDVHLEFVGDVSVHENRIRSSELGVSIRPRVPYAESQRLVRGSDVNVVLQTLSEGDDVIAGKTFDYLAAKKPILAVVPTTGGDAWLLAQTGGAEICSYADPEDIGAAIRRCWVRWRSGAAQPTQHLERFERKTLTANLAELLGEVLRETS
jgi:glycosyltransferase involved in cell wall biosynthesis